MFDVVTNASLVYAQICRYVIPGFVVMPDCSGLSVILDDMDKLESVEPWSTSLCIKFTIMFSLTNMFCSLWIGRGIS